MQFGLDSAWPSSTPTDLKALGYDFAMGYLGGRAEHVWTPDDWRRHQLVGLQLGPIWVSPSSAGTYGAGVTDGNKALDAMHANGLTGIFFLDIENGIVQTEYTSGVCDAAHAGSCSVGVYGSTPTIRGMVAEAGTWFWDKTWLANWVQSGLRLAPAMPDWDMLQYATGPQFDYDLAVDDMFFASLSGA